MKIKERTFRGICTKVWMDCWPLPSLQFNFLCCFLSSTFVSYPDIPYYSASIRYLITFPSHSLSSTTFLFTLPLGFLFFPSYLLVSHFPSITILQLNYFSVLLSFAFAIFPPLPFFATFPLLPFLFYLSSSTFSQQPFLYQLISAPFPPLPFLRYLSSATFPPLPFLY